MKYQKSNRLLNVYAFCMCMLVAVIAVVLLYNKFWAAAITLLVGMILGVLFGYSAAQLDNHALLKEKSKRLKKYRKYGIEGAQQEEGL